MKITLLIAILTLGLLPGLNYKADAQNCQPQSQIYISGYQRCGTPIYMVRYVVGYDRCGRPVWGVRGLSQYELHRQQQYHHQSRYSGYVQPRYAGYGETRISYSTNTGRGYTYRYYQSSPGRCRGW